MILDELQKGSTMLRASKSNMMSKSSKKKKSSTKKGKAKELDR